MSNKIITLSNLATYDAKIKDYIANSISDTTYVVKTATATVWTSNNPTLLKGEIGFESDTKKLKVGDGTTPWNKLSYITPTKVSELENDSKFLTETTGYTRTTLDTKLSNKADKSTVYTTTETDNLLANKIDLSQKGVASGVATLDSTGKIPSSQLPSYVDDVLEYSAKSSFPSSGETGKIYVDKATNKTYRWSGSAYVEISSSLALGETSSTAYAGNKGKANAEAITTLTNTKANKSDVYTKTESDAKYAAKSITDYSENFTRNTTIDADGLTVSQVYEGDGEKYTAEYQENAIYYTYENLNEDTVKTFKLAFPEKSGTITLQTDLQALNQTLEKDIKDLQDLVEDTTDDLQTQITDLELGLEVAEKRVDSIKNASSINFSSEDEDGFESTSKLNSKELTVRYSDESGNSYSSIGAGGFTTQTTYDEDGIVKKTIYNNGSIRYTYTDTVTGSSKNVAVTLPEESGVLATDKDLDALAETVSNSLFAIEVGDTVVAKADWANDAATAQRDANYKVIHDTYATKEELTEVDNFVADIMFGKTVVPKADEANAANYAIRAQKDYNSNIIHETYATKADLQKTDGFVADIMFGDTVVPKAAEAKGADYAMKAQKDHNGAVIHETYATKVDLQKTDGFVSDIMLGETVVPKAAEAQGANYAIKASQDAKGNVIDTYYATKASVTNITNGTTTVAKATSATKDAKGHTIDTYYATKEELSGVSGGASEAYATKSALKEVDDRLSDIELGETTVPKATVANQASYALRATSDGNNKNIAETYATKEELTEVDNFVADIMFGKTVVPSADEANSANYAIRANKDYNSNVIHETYATKTELAGKQAVINSSNKLAASNVSGLATVATSGSYNDLSNKPTTLKNPNSIGLKVNSETSAFVTYDGSAAKTITIKPSSTAGAFTISDGTTTKTIQLAGKFTDSNTTYNAATTTTAGLMSAIDKSNLDTLVNSFSSDDSNTTIDTIKEVLNAFANAPEETNIVNALAGKASSTHTHGNITNDGKLGTASRVVVTDGNKNVTVSSSITTTELGYLDGVTSNIQTQLSDLDDYISDVETEVYNIIDGKTAVTEALIAGKATKDSAGNVISTTYATKTELSGKANATHGTHVTTDTVKTALGVSSTGTKFLKEDGTWATPANTTYSSKTATSGGTAVSLVTTGEKYIWNNKQNAITSSNKLAASNVSGLATVATSGSYNDLSNKPTILTLGTTSTTAAAGNHTHSTYATKEELTALDDYISNVDSEVYDIIEGKTKVPSAAVADKAAKDSAGNTISLTYSKIGHTHGITTSNVAPNAHTHAYDKTTGVSLTANTATATGRITYVQGISSTGASASGTAKAGSETHTHTYEKVTGINLGSNTTADGGIPYVVSISGSAPSLGGTKTFVTGVTTGSGSLKSYDAASSGNVKTSSGRIPYIAGVSHTAASLTGTTTFVTAQGTFSAGTTPVSSASPKTTSTASGSAGSTTIGSYSAGVLTINNVANHTHTYDKTTSITLTRGTAPSLGAATTGSVGISGGSISTTTYYLDHAHTSAKSSGTGTVSISGGAFSATTNYFHPSITTETVASGTPSATTSFVTGVQGGTTTATTRYLSAAPTNTSTTSGANSGTAVAAVTSVAASTN